MKTFEILYNGAVIVEAETEKEAINIFNNKCWNYGYIDIDKIIEVKEND